MASEGTEKFGVNDVPRFLTETVDEAKKISHPTRQETVQATIVTVIIVCFVSTCLFVLDFVFNLLMRQVLG
jgi:preprotein translocase SecE subunit